MYGVICFSIVFTVRKIGSNTRLWTIGVERRTNPRVNNSPYGHNVGHVGFRVALFSNGRERKLKKKANRRGKRAFSR